MKKDSAQRISETLSSLDNVQRAEASPYLYSKIKNRLQHAQENIPQIIAWRMIAVLAIVALLNVFTLGHFAAEKKSLTTAEAIAAEYAVAMPQTY